MNVWMSKQGKLQGSTLISTLPKLIQHPSWKHFILNNLHIFPKYFTRKPKRSQPFGDTWPACMTLNSCKCKTASWNCEASQGITPSLVAKTIKSELFFWALKWSLREKYQMGIIWRTVYWKGMVNYMLKTTLREMQINCLKFQSWFIPTKFKLTFYHCSEQGLELESDSSHLFFPLI